ncbi:26156_t:CDS:1, partial [Racocetra persica]
SGGQTGVDRGALDVARDFNKLEINKYNTTINFSGWCPKGRKAEDGQIPMEYPLKETETEQYSERTELNVKDSEATLILLLEKNEIDRGTQYTIDKVKEFEKPYIIVYLSDNHQENVKRVLGWLNEHQINHLNVSGPRESNAEGIYNKA